MVRAREREIDFSLSTLKVFIGRVKPLRLNSPTNSISACASMALRTLMSIEDLAILGFAAEAGGEIRNLSGH